jgi:hypothetical protein
VAELGALGSGATWRRAALRGAFTGLFLALVVLALWPIDGHDNFNWRHLAWDDMGQFFSSKALAASAFVLFFLLGFLALPIAIVEMRTKPGELTTGEKLRRVTLAGVVSAGLILAISLQSLYLGDVFNGGMSFQRGMRELGGELTLMQDCWDAIAIRGAAMLVPLLAVLWFRLGKRSLARQAIGSAVLTLVPLEYFVIADVFWWNANETSHGQMSWWRKSDSGAGLGRYALVATALALVEPFLIVAADRADARLSRWLSPEDAS